MFGSRQCRFSSMDGPNFSVLSDFGRGNTTPFALAGEMAYVGKCYIDDSSDIRYWCRENTSIDWHN
jgi:hypothetical protein